LTEYQTVNGTRTPVGTLDVEDESWVSFDTDLMAWELGVEIRVKDGTGTLTGGTNAELTNGCSLTPVVCGNSDNASGPITLTPSTNQTRTWRQYNNGNATSIANSVDNLLGHLGPVFRSVSSPSWMWDEAAAVNTLWGRCDNRLHPSACVDDVSPLVLICSALIHPAVTPVAQHVYDAQRSLPSRWGDPTYGNHLLRTLKQSDIDANRAVACPDVPPPPLGMSCDEFPMASTKQGAAFVAANDYSTRTVPVSAQNSQGGITSTFYANERVIDVDTFWVLAVLPDGSRSWD
jgi:hypothetical protein